MVAVPGPEIPVTTPVVGFTVAIEGALLLHPPPADVELRVNVLPTQPDVVPVITAGNACTVTVAVRRQPEGAV